MAEAVEVGFWGTFYVMAGNFYFICGDDDFLVSREARALFADWTKDLTDDLSREVIEGDAGNLEEVARAVAETVSAVLTLSLFGERKAVWLRGVTFLGDNVTGRSEGAKAQVEKLQQALESVDPEQVRVLITASPVDRRRKEFKWFQKHAEMRDYKGDDGAGNVLNLAREEAERCNVRFGSGGLEALVETVGGNSRLTLLETQKLCSYLGAEGGTITPKLVGELVPNFGDSDFFEAAEAFFAFDLEWTLAALRRHFFTNKDARGILTTLQNRNRLLIQLKALMDAGEIRLGPRGFDKGGFERAWDRYQEHFFGDREKNGFNVFSQNLWYLGNKVATGAESISLRRLMQFQSEFLQAFDAIIQRPNEQHEVMNALAIRCLG